MRPLLLLLIFLCATPARGEPPSALMPDEVRRILSLGPWPVPARRDASNRFSGSRRAAEFGRALFFDEGLSRFGSLSCASCHKPDKAWSDGRARASAAAALDRNTPTLLNTGHLAAFGWDGGADSLWMQSIRPLLDRREMAADAEHVRRRIAEHGPHRAAYRALTGREPADAGAERVLVDTAKVLAAFQETLTTGRTPFDDFRLALARRDARGMARYPEAAQRGLRIFVGRGQCSQCHGGALLGGDGFYAVAGAAPAQPHGGVGGRIDLGRTDGILKLRSSPYTRSSRYSDGAGRRIGDKTPAAVTDAGLDGAFRAPPLRGVSATSPYMHDGSRATLADAVRHITALPAGPVRGSRRLTLAAVTLSDEDIADLVAFIGTVSEAGPAPR